MNWKFWEKSTDAQGAAKLPKPKDLPSGVGKFLVVNLRHDPDWVWALKSVSRPKEGARKGVFEVRVFSETDARNKGVSVKNFNTLTEHPELILFDGFYDKNTWAVKIEQRFVKRPTAA